MAKVKAGFENGNVVVCVDASGRSSLIEGKEYEVMSYCAPISINLSTKNKRLSNIFWCIRYKNADERFPAVIICDENFNRQVVPCRYFMAKSDYLIKTRNSKIDCIMSK